MNKMALSLFKSQLPSLIEKFEPELEKALRDTLRSVKTSNPSEAELFLTNWRKLDKAIKEELETAAPAPVAPAPVAPVMTGGDEPTGPTGPVPSIPEPSPPIIEPTGPTGPVLPTSPPTVEATGPTGQSFVDSFVSYFSSASGPTGGKKHRKRKTAKQHRKRTHRVKHRKH